MTAGTAASISAKPGPATREEQVAGQKAAGPEALDVGVSLDSSIGDNADPYIMVQIIVRGPAVF